MAHPIHDSTKISWGSISDAEPREIFAGITARTIWEGDDQSKAMVVEFEPGSKWDGVDKHEPGPEEVYVISGILNDGERDYFAGSFIHNPRGSFHIPQSVNGCKLFLFFPFG